jgi:hypothetical protein
MAKNRKNQAAEIRFGPVIKVVLLCSLICGSAIGYVWQKSQIDRLGRKISEDENAFLHSPVMLDRRVKELNLGLAPAQPLQVVRLTDLPPAPGQDGPRQFAQRPVPGATQ